MRRRLSLAAAAALAALALAACGEKHDALHATAADDQSISLQLDRPAGADHVGLYAAHADGAFADAGLKVDIRAPADSSRPLAQVESGAVDVAVASEPQLMLARNQGATLIAFGALVQRPLSSIISLASRHISSPADLKGATVGTGGLAYQRAYLQTILAHAHVAAKTVTQVDVGSDLVGSLISHRVGATLGGFWNDDALRLRAQHRRPDVIPVDRAGVPTYDELVLVTTETYFADHTSALRRLVQAIGRGYTASRADPSAGVNALVAANPSLDRAQTATAVTATLPAFFPGGGHPFGWQTQQQWNAYGRWMLAHHLISGPQAYAAASTNQLLAGQGP